MDKVDYFPRKKFFEDAQDLIATFYSTGDFISENNSSYTSMLVTEGEKDDFFYCLYLISMLSNANSILKAVDKIMYSMNTFRVKHRVTSTEEFAGEIDIEKYIQKNHVEKVHPKEFPSIIKYSTFQVPEYQMTLFILKRIEEIYTNIFNVLGENSNVTAFKIAKVNFHKVVSRRLLLQRKYGISYRYRETYMSLKKKVVYRYKNRKILTDNYKVLMKLYEKMIYLNGIDFDSDTSLDIYDNYESFDDRLFEIWLIRKSAEMLAGKMGTSVNDIKYKPLYRARRNNECVVSIECEDYRIEILFQNRKKYMPKDELKWYWENNGIMEEIGAIPDLIFLKYPAESEEFKEIVLVDAKNRNWTFNNDMQRIKSDIVQQIYIQDNFISIFEEKFSSILVAHNVNSYQSRKYKHKDKLDYEIDVISLDINEARIIPSLNNYVEDLSKYLRL